MCFSAVREDRMRGGRNKFGTYYKQDRAIRIKKFQSCKVSRNISPNCVGGIGESNNIYYGAGRGQTSPSTSAKIATPTMAEHSVSSTYVICLDSLAMLCHYTFNSFIFSRIPLQFWAFPHSMQIDTTNNKRRINGCANMPAVLCCSGNNPAILQK